MDGIPARISRTGLKISLIRSLAYSLKNIALPNPSGTEIMAERKAINSVPVINGKTPKLSGETLLAKGRQVVPVKNFNNETSGRLKKPMVSENNETMIPIVTKTENTPHKKRIAEMIFSRFISFLECPRKVEDFFIS